MPRQAAQISNDLGTMFGNRDIRVNTSNAAIGINNIRITAREPGNTEIHPGAILTGKGPAGIGQ